MLVGLSQRLLTLLQLTRMALVFTAIADSQCALLLFTRAHLGEGDAFGGHLDVVRMLLVAMISVGLYGFGMSLNDIIDRRRDRQISPNRPLPSGRLGIVAAHVVCVALALMAFTAGLLLHSRGGGAVALALIGVTLLLICFYDLAGKYLVAPGLVTLGLVRFFHAMIPAASMPAIPDWTLPNHVPFPLLPHVAVVWHPLWLLNHVTILSTIAYHWEEKRPALNRRQWWGVAISLLALDVAAVALVQQRGTGTFFENLRPSPGLLLPVAAAILFIGIGWRLRKTSATSREAGQKLMLYGLLWLIVYDACFAAVYASLVAGLCLLLLLPVAYFSVQLMRWWSKLTAVSQRPAFKCAGT